MMNIRIIKTGIDVSKIKEQLDLYKEDWNSQQKLANTGEMQHADLNSYGEKSIDVLKHQQEEMTHVDYADVENGEHVHHRVGVDVLQLVMGGITKEGEDSRNTEICIPTPAYFKHTAIIDWIKENFRSLGRCGFLALPVGEEVMPHIDIGSYYLNKDRYHLSIQGRYRYTVDGEEAVIEPGTFFWFDNKKMHESVNIGDETRITFVFDVTHTDLNP
jgi:hypothetical protein